MTALAARLDDPQVRRTRAKFRALYPVAPQRPDPLTWAHERAIIRTASGSIVRYGDVARDYQDAILADPSKRIIVAKSRQIGISQTVAFLVALEGLNGGTALVVSRTGDQAVKFLQYVRTAISRLGVPLARDNQTSIAFANGGTIEVQAATRGAGRGIAATLVVLDEMAWMEYGDEIYTAVTPTLAETDGRLIILSSVKGRNNLFARLWFAAQDAASGWSPHFLPWHVHPVWRTIPDWPARKKDEDHLTDEAFAQEYDVDFLRSGGEVFTEEEIARLFRLAPPLVGAEPGHRYVSGFDIGRHNDAFVGITYDVSTAPFRVVAFARHLNLPYPQQAAVIEDRARRFPGPVLVESNGIGDPLIEFLTIRVEPFQTSARSKRNALDALKLLMQRGELAAPNDPALAQFRRELGVYQFNDTNLVQDCVMAAAIAALRAGRPVRAFAASVGGERVIPAPR